MTNSEAIKVFENLTDCEWTECHGECSICVLAVKVEDALEAYRMAMTALREKEEK